MSEYPPQGPPPGYSPQGQQPGVPMPQPQYNPGPPPPQQMQTTQAATVTVVTQPGMQRPGACPYCGIGFARSDYTILGILIALLFFPLGIICCMMMTETKCTNCNRRL
ncbi:hypothetical protein ACF0H5_000598 [Mactra antiquata]